jgi:hypothetical protein
MEMILPSEMMFTLHAPFPEACRIRLRWADLDMLRTLYRENPNHPQVREARLAMETAISKWSDSQVADFLLKHLFQPPQSTELQSKSLSELRQLLVVIYDCLFIE